MARTQTLVQLSDELVDMLDRRAAAAGVSRSSLIRQAVETFLARDREAEIDRQIVDGYTRLPQGGEFDDDEWGDMGGFTTALMEDNMRQLRADEDEAGMPPW